MGNILIIKLLNCKFKYFNLTVLSSRAPCVSVLSEFCMKKS